MESKWRLGIIDVGRCGPPWNAIEPDSYCTLVARLITPIDLGPWVIRWVYQKWTPYGYRGGYGASSLTVPEQMVIEFGSFLGRFPYGFAVEPDG